MLKVPVTPADHIQGDLKARIILVEYGDYECPFCGSAYPIIKRVQKHFGKNLCFVFRNFPLVEAHPYAGIAAITAEFAGSKQKFWEMHDILYENQQALEVPDLLSYAESLKLSPAELQDAITHEKFADKIKNDFMGGVKSGVNGTPMFFINGNRHNGSFEYDELVDAIEQTSSVIK